MWELGQQPKQPVWGVGKTEVEKVVERVEKYWLKLQNKYKKNTGGDSLEYQLKSSNDEWTG